MFERELMIAGIRRQEELLKDLGFHLAQKTKLGFDDCQRHDDVLKKVEKNLRSLRRLRVVCLECREPEMEEKS